MSEIGVYYQVWIVGFAAGWDSEYGLTFSVFESTSVGVSQDVWQSFHLDFTGTNGWSPVVAEPLATYVGVGSPTSVPTPFTVNVQINNATGDLFTTIGMPLNPAAAADFNEVGLYGEFPFKNMSNAEFFSQYAYSGTVSSANMPGQYGPVFLGYETNGLDVMGDTRPFCFQGNTDDGLSDSQKAAYTNKIRAQTETIDAVNTDYFFNLASNVSVSDLVRNSQNSQANPHAGHNHSSTVGQNNSQLDRGLDALNTVGSGIDLDAVQNTNTVNFTPRVSDMDTGGIGGGLLQPIVVDLDGDGISMPLFVVALPNLKTGSHFYF